jgi:suppressor of tumorigenicity protein 13
MPGMADILGDPEIAAGLQNPKVMSALTSMMTNPDPSKITQLMMDPEVGPIMQKLMSKLGPTMGGGMPGGMGGFGGSHRDSSAKDGDGDDDDLPDLDDIPNL